MPFETDKSNGFKFDATQLLKTGVYPDVFDKQIPMWEEVNGVQYNEFGMKRKAGREQIATFSFTKDATGLQIQSLSVLTSFTASAQPSFAGDFDFYVLLKLFGINNFQAGETITLSGVGAGAGDNPDQNGDRVITHVGSSLGDTVLFYGIDGVDQNQDYAVDTNSIIVLSASSVTLPTSIRGLTAINNEGEKIAYIADLQNIYSYKFSDDSTDLAGSGFSLVADSSGTAWSDSGTATTWDVESGISDTFWDGTGGSQQWDFETYGSFVVGAYGSTPVIKKNNLTFNTFSSNNVVGLTIVNQGTSGYVVGDEIVGTSGASTIEAQVTKVSSGKVTELKVTFWGSASQQAALNNDDVITLTVPGSTSPAARVGAVTAKVSQPTGVPANVKVFHKQGPHLLSFFERTFNFCSAGNLDDWDATSETNTAGELRIREANTDIVAVRQLGSNLAVYTENQMFLVSYIGLPNIFGYKLALEGSIGAVSCQSVVSVGRKNYGLCKDGFFVTDGSSVEMIGRSTGINDFFAKNAAFAELGEVYAFDNSKENEVTWGLPLNSSTISKEVYYNYKTGQWGMRDSNITAYLDRGVFSFPISGDNTGAFFFEGTTPRLTDNISAVSKGHDFNNSERIKEVTAIRVNKEGNGSPSVQIGASDTPDGNVTYTAEYVVDDSYKSFPLRVAGRYLTIKVTSKGPMDDWTITNMEIQGRFEGER